MKLKLNVFFAAIVSIFVAHSCNGVGPESVEPQLSVRKSELGADAGSLFVSVVADGSWTLSLETADGSAIWGSLNTTSGSGSRSNVIFTYENNPEESSRTISIVLKTGSYRKDCRLTQAGKGGGNQGGGNQGGGDNPGGDNPGGSDKVSAWLELPAVQSGSNLMFITHDMTLNGKTVRNWSCQYDTDALVSHWVAYPLNSSLIGSGSRTNEWGLDPKVPESKQPVLYKGFGSSGYDRGHQIPSADRLNRAANITTFYGTNMTPQLSGLNQKSWANLEGGVRDWARSFDTLYVVTGCVVKGSTKKAYDNNGKAVTVPVGYYKALLGYKKSQTIAASTAGYTSIAFWFDHKAFDGDYMTKAMTVDELEQKTGIDFFVNLPAKIGPTLADKVESTLDSWW